MSDKAEEEEETRRWDPGTVYLKMREVTDKLVELEYLVADRKSVPEDVRSSIRDLARSARYVMLIVADAAGVPRTALNGKNET